MAELCESFARLQRGAIDSATFERTLLEAVLCFPCWDAPEQPPIGWRRTAVGEHFNPLIVTRNDIPILPVFDDPETIEPWLERRGNVNLARQLSFATMHGGDLISSIGESVHMLVVFSNGNMVEFDPSQLARMRSNGTH